MLYRQLRSRKAQLLETAKLIEEQTKIFGKVKKICSSIRNTTGYMLQEMASITGYYPLHRLS
jgi:hypothetical protein